MCTIPPPPPPPTAALCASTSESTDKTQPISFAQNIDVCCWAADNPELQDACMKSRICYNEAPFKYKYKHFDSILQEGPTCGLVASSMLIGGKVSPSEILEIARKAAYTNNGEMFSCKNMVKLIEKLFDMAGIGNCDIILENGHLYSAKIIERILNGAVLLVPYDADFNHTPCLKNGHKAHWSLVCGILIEKDPEGSLTSAPHNVNVLCKHGKSKYLAVWNLKDLEMSNRNLHEFSPRRGEQMSMYVIPEGGVGGENGLKNQFIIIEGLK